MQWIQIIIFLLAVNGLFALFSVRFNDFLHVLASTRKSSLQDKIFGDKDEQGYAKVSKVRIIRATKDSKGAARKLPWYVEVENGKGVPQKNANGGTYMKPNSFVSTGKVYANLSDLDLFDLLSSVSSYIDCWEHAIAPALITKAKNAVAARQSSRNAA